MILRLYAKAQVWRAAIRDRVLEDRGATAVEYALMLALIFMVVIGAVAFLGQRRTRSSRRSTSRSAVPRREGAHGERAASLRLP